MPQKCCLKKFLTDPLFLSFFTFLVLGIGLFAIKNPAVFFSKPKIIPEKEISLINRIEISFNNQKIKRTDLIKENNKWLIASDQNKEANLEKINNLLDQIKSLKKNEIVSNNKKNFEKFGVDEKNAINIKLFENEKIVLELLAGKTGPDFEKDYLLIKGEEIVFLGGKNLRSLLYENNWALSEAKNDSAPKENN